MAARNRRLIVLGTAAAFGVIILGRGAEVDWDWQGAASPGAPTLPASGDRDAATQSEPVGGGLVALSFPNLTSRIPDARLLTRQILLDELEQSVTIRVAGEGSPMLSVNGGPWQQQAAVDPGDRLRISVTSPPGFATSSTVRILTNDAVVAEWSLRTLEAPPRDRLVFSPTFEAEPGTRVFSNFVAPEGYPRRSEVEVTGPGSPIIRTKEGDFADQATVDPGDIFQVIARAPEGSGAVSTLVVRLAGQSAEWHVVSKVDQVFDSGVRRQQWRH